MGVKNLWRLLLPVGHRLSIETLSHQTLAIDASIWLTQVSKACRDPETGRLLPNKPHVRIFLLRLMRLLYHQIKPVVVFDGVMPEAKRREIQRRKDRRERLWRDDEDGGDGSAGGGALRRAAKKILIKKLKEQREREARSKKKGGNDTVENEDENISKNATAGQSSNGGALAAGFTLEEDADTDKISPVKVSTPSKNVAGATQVKTGESEDVISIDSNDTKEKSMQQFQSQLGQFKQQHADDEGEGDKYESENDWEMSHAVQSSINDSIQQQQSSSSNNANGYNGPPNYFKSDENPFENDFYQQASNETIASLPSDVRSRWIDHQKATRRIQSRQECIQAAANPEDYSSTQLKEFLKVSKLNKRVGEIDKLAKCRQDSEETGGNVGDGNLDVVVRNAQHTRPALQRLRRHNNGDSNDDDEDSDIFNSSNGVRNGRASMKILFGDDDSEEDDDEDGGGGGGFLLPSSTKNNASNADSSAQHEKNEVVLLDNDSDNSDTDSQSTDNATSTKNETGAMNKNAPNIQKDNIINAPYENFHPSKLLELSNAQQEWEHWGGVANKDTDTLESDTNCFDRTHVSKINNDTDMGASESESDEDDDQGGTFLTLTTKPVIASATMKNAPINVDSQNDANVECEVDADDSEVDCDWEDGDSGGDGVQTDNNDTKNEAQEPSIGHHVDTYSDKNDNSILKENHSAYADTPKRESSRERERKHPEQVDNLNNNDNAIEIPSDGDASLQRADEYNEKKNMHVSSPAPNNDKAETLLIDDPDEGPGENEFESFQPDNETTVALQHAQETASRLTSWAGRAFQRAISEHVGDKGEKESSEEQMMATGDAITLDAGDTRIDSSEVNGLEQSKTTGTNDVNHHSSPEQNKSHRKLNLFDTSLEGLNEAHNAIFEEEKAMQTRDMSTITDEMKDDILKLLQLCGIPWVESPSEAEAQCAALEEIGLVDGVVTEDSDIFVFGGKKVYKNFFNEQKYVEAYFARDIERDLALKKHQLVALAMLLGGDYTDGVKGVGIVNGMELLQAFPIGDSTDGVKDGLQNFRAWLDGFGDSLNGGNGEKSSSKERSFHKKHQSARTRWVAPADFPSQAIINAYLKPVVETSKTKFSWAKPDLSGLQRFCAETLGWEEEECSRIVNPVLQVLESGSKQTRLESFFMKYEDGITFAKVKSKRLKAVLDDIQGNHNENSKDIESAAADDADSEAQEIDEDTKPKKKRRRKKN